MADFEDLTGDALKLFSAIIRWNESPLIQDSAQRFVRWLYGNGEIDGDDVVEIVPELDEATYQDCRKRIAEKVGWTLSALDKYRTSTNGKKPEPEHTRPISIEHSRETDLANAERLEKLEGDYIRHVELWRKWQVWDEIRWSTDDSNRMTSLAKTAVRSIYQEAADEPNDAKRSKRVNWAIRSEARDRIAAMIDLTKSSRAALPKDFDRNPLLFNVANGTLDLSPAGISFRNHNPADMITKLADIEYNPEADCPRWDQFLREIFSDDLELIDYVRRCVGCALCADKTEHVLFVLHGLGENGKSTFLNALLHVFGEYATHTPTETLMMKRSESIPNDVARLRSVRLVTAIEADENRRLSESLIKQLTGNDRVTARFLHAEFFEFEPEFKIFLATNHLPRIHGTDHAIWRRIRLIPFQEQFKEDDPRRDPNLREKLKQESSGILNWILTGVEKWREVGLGSPKAVTNATASYKSDSDIVGQWIASRCVFEPGNSQISAQSSVLYKDYKAWAEDNGHPMLTQKALSTRLTERGLESTRKTAGMIWLGIRLCTDLELAEKRSEMED